MKQTFRLDCHTSTLNQLLMGRWAGYRLKKRDKQIVAVACLADGITKASTPRRVSLLLTMAPRRRRPDRDAFWKSLLDALVACGALVNDSPKWCSLGDVEYQRGESDQMHVTLEDIAPE